MRAYVFPGQGAQFSGMGKELFDASADARKLFDRANEVLGFDIASIMFEGSDEALKQTNVTQPAIFIQSTVLAACLGDSFKPDMVAGHSLGEFSALVANKTLSFEDGLRLVSARARAMQKACELIPSTMAAILGLEDSVVEEICSSIDGVVVPANYNCPGQLVISGEIKAVEDACAKLTEAGAKRALILQVGGAFHSPLMEPARAELASAIESTQFNHPTCPIYQNVNALPVTDPSLIKANLLAQLTAPVKWTQIMMAMNDHGLSGVIEVGPGKVLQGLFKKINRELPVSSATIG
jgi:[acyl-carrier-protein] S-malonyltransferase